MTRTTALAALAAALALHAPIAFALLDAPASASPLPGKAPVRSAEIDLRTIPRIVTPHSTPSTKRSRTFATGATRSSGGGSRSSVVAAGPRRALVRLPDRVSDETPAARAVAFGDGIAARTDSELAPDGLVRGGAGAGRGEGRGAGEGRGTTRALELSEVDIAPRRIAGEEPAYPRLDVLAGREGWVTLRFVVGAEGSVSSISIEDSSGPASFIAAAREAVAAWRFAPALSKGERVACVCLQRLTFKLGARR